jgi:threonine dehydrogenase-like Zn-dependent dehydrogenase
LGEANEKGGGGEAPFVPLELPKTDFLGRFTVIPLVDPLGVFWELIVEFETTFFGICSVLVAGSGVFGLLCEAPERLRSGCRLFVSTDNISRAF